MGLLSVDLREGTKSIHAAAGRSKFVKHIFKAEIPQATFGRFLISLYHIYNTLERVLADHVNNAQLDLIYFPDQLARKEILEQDLERFHGPQWRDLLVTTSPAQQKYINAIEHCASSATPELLIAHSYVRYMGDLSGGQIIAKRLKSYNVGFFTFDKIEDHDLFKEFFRKRLNQVKISDELKDKIVEEAKAAFHLNMEIFSEFDHELEGMPMTEEEQMKELASFQKEKDEMEAAKAHEKITVHLRTTSSTENNSGILSYLAPFNLWKSLKGAVGVQVDA
ncbi:heme oxygenase (decycling) 1 [Haplosporangium sp. Z 767]|nr:heme oxygenase (decycling) 1 [Haplosporangium sp. Z 11]KAF9195499.1 heme oxygenase (decycling) 1 [Haplosporangium sp. Z 767]